MHCRFCVASALKYLALVTVLDYSVSKAATKVRLHCNNVCDVIITHNKCRHINKPTDTENIKQSQEQPAMSEAHGRLVTTKTQKYGHTSFSASFS